jgi:hypothetical protein
MIRSEHPISLPRIEKTKKSCLSNKTKQNHKLNSNHLDRVFLPELEGHYDYSKDDKISRQHTGTTLDMQSHMKQALHLHAWQPAHPGRCSHLGQSNLKGGLYSQRLPGTHNAALLMALLSAALSS